MHGRLDHNCIIALRVHVRPRQSFAGGVLLRYRDIVIVHDSEYPVPNPVARAVPRKVPSPTGETRTAIRIQSGDNSNMANE